ncbi:MAG: hypothetical protein ABW189_06885 [Rickettsiales bacterium]
MPGCASNDEMIACFCTPFANRPKTPRKKMALKGSFLFSMGRLIPPYFDAFGRRDCAVYDIFMAFVKQLETIEWVLCQLKYNLWLYF